MSASKSTSSSSKSAAAAQTSMTNPVELASSAGASGSSWHRLGNGPWSGTVRVPGGQELTVEELGTGWKVTDETGRSRTGRQLEPLLRTTIEKPTTNQKASS